MKCSKISHFILGLIAVAAVSLPTGAHACAACFGRSDSRLAQGMNMGILVLLFFIVSMLVMISMFFVFLGRRASQHPLPGHSDQTATAPNDLHN